MDVVALIVEIIAEVAVMATGTALVEVDLVVSVTDQWLATMTDEAVLMVVVVVAAVVVEVAMLLVDHVPTVDTNEGHLKGDQQDTDKDNDTKDLVANAVVAVVDTVAVPGPPTDHMVVVVVVAVKVHGVIKATTVVASGDPLLNLEVTEIGVTAAALIIKAVAMAVAVTLSGDRTTTRVIIRVMAVATTRANMVVNGTAVAIEDRHSPILFHHSPVFLKVGVYLLEAGGSSSSSTNSSSVTR